FAYPRRYPFEKVTYSWAVTQLDLQARWRPSLNPKASYINVTNSSRLWPFGLSLSVVGCDTLFKPLHMYCVCNFFSASLLSSSLQREKQAALRVNHTMACSYTEFLVEEFERLSSF
ncbi:hypothetical protein ACK348_08830, partial [Aeromonas veronii]